MRCETLMVMFILIVAGSWIFECQHLERNFCNVTAIKSVPPTNNGDLIDITSNLTDLKPTKDLSKLIINSFNITEVPSNICDTLPLLQDLAITNANINRFSLDSLQHCTILQKLDLSQNRLRELLVSSSNVSYVSVLNLSSNHLTDIDLPQIFGTFPKLRILDLTGNYFHCARIEAMIDELRERRVKFQTNGRRINCINSTEWIHMDGTFNASPKVIKSVLHIIEGTEYRLRKMLEQDKTHLVKFRNESETDFTRIETSLAQNMVQVDTQLRELQIKFAMYMEVTSQEMASLNRLLYFCYALLIALVIVMIANIFRHSCRSRKIGEKPRKMSQALVEVKHEPGT